MKPSLYWNKVCLLAQAEKLAVINTRPALGEQNTELKFQQRDGKHSKQESWERIQ